MREHGLVDPERRLGAVRLDAPHVVRPAPRQRRAQRVHLKRQKKDKIQKTVRCGTGWVGESRTGEMGWKRRHYVRQPSACGMLSTPLPRREVAGGRAWIRHKYVGEEASRHPRLFQQAGFAIAFLPSRRGFFTECFLPRLVTGARA